MDSSNERKLRTAVSFVFAGVAALLWMGACDWLERVQLDAPKSISHITRYIICLAIFVAVFCGSALLLQRIQFKWKDSYTWHLAAMLLPLAALCFAAVCVPYIKTMLGTEYAQYVDLRVQVLIVLGGLLGIVAWHWFRKKPLRPMGITAQKALLMGAVAVAVFAAAYTAYAPNVGLLSKDYEAYWFSTFSLVRGLPVDVITASFYGHYGMLQAPFFWLVGGFTPYTCAALTALEAGLTMLAMCYVVCRVTSKQWLRFVGIGLLLFRMLKQTITYAQGYPHRFLFQALLLAFGVWFLKRIDAHGKRFFVCGITAGYVLVALGTIWSCDTGLFGLMTWGVLHLYCLMTRSPKRGKIPQHMAVAAASTAGALVGAWGFTSLLNIVVWKGSSLSFRLFMFPLFETVQDSMFEGGTLPLLAPWVPAFLFLLYYVAQGLANTSLLSTQPRKNFETDIAMFSAMLGISSLIYFFNRATYGAFYIGYFPLIVCMLVAAQRMCSMRKPSGQSAAQQFTWSIKQGACLVSVVVPLCLCAAMLAELPINFAATHRDRAMQGMEQIKAQMLNDFPAGTAVYGWNATYYNALLNAPTESIIWVPCNNVPRQYADEILRRRQQAANAVALTDKCWNEADYFGGIDRDEWASRYKNAVTVEGYYNNENSPEHSMPVVFYMFEPKAG